MYGIQMDKILERNYLRKGEEPTTGVTLNLNKKAEKKPIIRTDKTNTPASISVPLVKKEEMILPAKASPIYKTPENGSSKSSSINFNPFTFAQNTSSVNNSTPQPIGNYIYHSVQTGDTMYNISKKYQVDIEQIKSWNGMMDNNVQLNQQLIIYQ